MRPLVSVIMAVYNGEKYLGEAFESIVAQTDSCIEIVIVDDGSTDDTELVAKKYDVVYVSQPNRGQPSALNEGLRIAQGAYIAFLDADDLYMPDKTALQTEFLEASPQVDCVFGYVEQFFSPELSLEMQQKWVCPSENRPGYLAVAGLFRKECFEKVGLFNEERRIGAFIEWYMRAADLGLRHELIPHKVLRRRLHGNNMGISSGYSRLEYVQIVKEALKRRILAERAQ